jgi:autotransporter-associated beta strand protein
MIYVTWSAASGADGYVLSRGGTPIATLSTTNYYLNTGLAASSTYCYTVTATNQVGSSSPSSSVCATTPAATASLTWDAGSSPTGPQDGSDNWGTAALTWWNGSLASLGADSSLAIFGAGTTTNCLVTLLNDVTPSGFLFNANGGGNYNITNGGGTINLSGTVPVVANGDASITTFLKGTGQIVKSGPGTLTLTAANTNSGAFTVNGGRIVATVSPWYSPRSIGSGALTVNNGAVAEFTGTHGFGADAGGRAATLSNGGTLQFDKENYVSGLTMTAGSIIGAGEMRTEGVTYNINSASASSTLQCPINFVNSCTFNVANGAAPVDLLASGSMYGSGGFTKAGAGLMQVTGASTYAGTTTITAGNLQVDGSLGTNTITVQNTATLSGNGTMNGPTTVQSGGTLAPGDGGNIGTVLFASSLVLNAGSKTLVKVSKTGFTLDNDLVSTLGAFTMGGTLTVTNAGPTPLAAGDSFDLFNSPTSSGSFSTKTLPSLAAGLAWDTSKLASSGVITVVSLPSVVMQPASTNINYGGSASLTASASGTAPLSYQWYDRNTNVIGGATDTALLLSTPAVAASGNYSVVVTNAFGKATNFCAVTVSPAPLTVTASNATKAAGQTLVFAGTEFSCAGLLLGDSVSSVSLSSAGADSSAAAGSYQIVPSNVQGTGLANYNIGYVNGTLTVTNSTVVIPVITTMASLGSAGFSLSGTGGVGQTFVLLMSSNLPPFSGWTSLATNAASTNGVFQFTDAQATNDAQRFYRIQAR